ncbi:metallophosphoesterase family protein [Ralstonia solanacearum]|uniref:metallophosphoesterase family protein n=1 Tax=Ralstonia solanacearum TaxID=305 RepID=UPI00078E8085|nr:metallophosphoesterase [Ralstonia solanacearum]AMP40362.1 hypothetical protein LBM2029_22775 [Ralstonia solanacearum]AXV89223.1 hypothetical protein CJO78_23550 [Ralstonia solanacearum]AXW08687.1 hypothetical protein CJO82_23220 [Ralstonia solanacearum]AXW26470.1 hypothetical protein CJO86_23490 [Ralstonia solanacearum]AXW83386.1 hypothetical protein CJO98_23580 [Ralstonia solanacearum]
MTRDDIKPRLNEAFRKFKEKASPEQLARFHAMLDEAHHQAAQLASDSATAPPIRHHILARAKSLLDEQVEPPDASQRARDTASAEGDLIGDKKYETFDVGWLESLICWFDHFGADNKTPFPTGAAPVIGIPDSVTIAIAGDWGTGTRWRQDGRSAPAELVANAMKKCSPHITIHLGDVYYAGTSDEETANLLAGWPRGSIASFTLNSNHEMYSGGIGYFNVALRDKAFSKQQNCSYFALCNKHWLVIGLDSAYHADELDLYQDGNLDADQLAFLRRMVAEFGERQIILLTHHNGLSLDGTRKQALWDQVIPVVAGRKVWWYWGHIHAGARYIPYGNVLPRCCGHGGMPYGAPSCLHENTKVTWYENRPANDAGYPARVFNGFALLKLENENLAETFVDERGRDVPTVASAKEVEAGFVALMSETNALKARMGARSTRFAKEVRALLEQVGHVYQLDPVKGRSLFETAKSRYHQSVGTENQMWFLLGALIGSTILILCAIALILARSDFPDQLKNLGPSDQIASLTFFAMLGSLTSIMLRLSKIDLQDEDRRIVIMFSAAIHPLMAGGFMAIIYVILQNQIISINLGKGEDAAKAVEWLAAFLCGFSEKFAPGILDRVGADFIATTPEEATAPKKP